MMQDNDLLSGIDLSGYTEADRDKIVQALYARLEDKVGEQVAAIVSDKHFAEFEDIVGLADEAKMEEWLDKNVPNYDQLTERVLEQLKQELSTNPDSFLAESNS